MLSWLVPLAFTVNVSRSIHMGLDQYAFRTCKEVLQEGHEELDFEIAYWRKHPNLHGWMQQLYAKRTGIEEPGAFNCKNVELTLADLDELEHAVRTDSLPHTIGFFFGESQPDERELDLQFISDAREAIADGERVYYTPWW
jgi:hypothetical protein